MSARAVPLAAVAEGYHAWLIDEIYEFVAAQYPEDVLPRDRFRELVAKYQDHAWLRAANRYFGDLYSLFAPDYQRRLPEYYAQQDFPLTMTLLSYARNVQVLTDNYIKPYQMARELLGPTTVLELGAGFPHGLLADVRSNQYAWITHLTSVETEATTKKFLEFFCRRYRIPHRSIAALAGTSPDLADVRGIGFVFAKDVFEHLLDPANAIMTVLKRAADRAFLALDLNDKGELVYQHVSPKLSVLIPLVEQAGFTRMGDAGNLMLFGRGV